MRTRARLLIIGVIDALVAPMLIVQGRNHMRKVHPIRESNLATLKEDIQWLKQQAS